MASPGFELVSTFWLILHVVARLPGVALSAALAFLASVYVGAFTAGALPVSHAFFCSQFGYL